MPLTPEQAAAVDAENKRLVQVHGAVERANVADLRADGKEAEADRRETRLMSVEDWAHTNL